jgi:hypothetical protein
MMASAPASATIDTSLTASSAAHALVFAKTGTRLSAAETMVFVASTRPSLVRYGSSPLSPWP